MASDGKTATLGRDADTLTAELPRAVRNRVSVSPEARANADQPPATPFNSLYEWQRAAILLFAGRFGTILGSLSALTIALSLTVDFEPWLIFLPLALITIRLGYCTTRGPQPILATRRIRKYFWRLMVDEGKISIIFMATCYFFNWGLDRTTVGIFVIANAAIQSVQFAFSRWGLNWLRSANKAKLQISLPKQVLIVGSGNHAKAVADMILDSPDLETGIVGFLDFSQQGLWRYRDIPLAGHPDQLNEIVESTQVDAIFLAVEPDDIGRSRPLFALAETMGLPLFVMPELYQANIASPHPAYINGLPAFLYRSTSANTAALFIKSFIDRTLAAVALLIVSPLLLTVAIAIRLESKGPIFFKQVRVGCNGRLFTMYKFRSMRTNAEQLKADLSDANEMNGPVFKIKKDPRITKVGRFIRKFSIDELPQLLNVLFADMSLVGPRPALPKEVREFQAWQRRKLSVKPGLTCIWQVSGRNSIPFEQWMKLDLEYIDRWSLWLDTKILLRTIPTVLKGSGM